MHREHIPALECSLVLVLVREDTKKAKRETNTEFLFQWLQWLDHQLQLFHLLLLLAFRPRTRKHQTCQSHAILFSLFTTAELPSLQVRISLQLRGFGLGIVELS